MAVPLEYNVIDGLIGLGEYIHLESMNEMDDSADVQQFIGVNKKTFQLKDHSRFQEVIQNAQTKLENPDPTGQGVRLERINGLLRKAVALQNVQLCISLNKIMRKGIHCLSVKFDKSNQLGYVNGLIGICKANHKITYPCDTDDKLNNQNMLGYTGLYDIQ
ncbi:MAG: hypothetical protein EZS28_016775 [Streblomastix strix]|uniref:Uncharacterized protein n=1 Tax=Streblomastix strix TaxID=222440 RepID=A0A5J4VZN4_9EUKA|nr:MAG: hypothetical protein EZS28_016775 [Streblomastix strix]